MTDDFTIGSLLEALQREGGVSQLIPPVSGVSSVDAFQALDTAIRRGLVSARTQRGGAGQLTAAIDLKLTESGVGFLSQHRRSVSHPGEGTSPQTALDPSLPARVQRRTQFIHRIYEEAQGSEAKVIDGPQAGDTFGWPRQETDDVMRYWEGEGLIRYVAEEGAICLTHGGIVEIERAGSNPEVATPHFAPHSVIIVENMNNSQIQTGTIGSTQASSSWAGVDDDTIREFLRTFRSALIESPLSNSEDGEEVAQLLTLADEELQRELPNKRHLRSLLGSLREVALGMAGSGAWTAVVALAHQLPH